MQSISLTDFPSKQAQVYRMKVSFLLEIRTGVGSTWREGLRGWGGHASLYQHYSEGPEGARGAAAISTGFVRLKRGSPCRPASRGARARQLHTFSRRATHLAVDLSRRGSQPDQCN